MSFPTHMTEDRVHKSGFACYEAHRIFLENPLIGEVIGFEEVTDRFCKIYFATAIIGILDLYTSKVLKYQKLLHRIDE